MVYPVERNVDSLAPTAPLLTLAGARLHTFRGPQGWAGVPSRIRRPENSVDGCSDPVFLREMYIFAGEPEALYPASGPPSLSEDAQIGLCVCRRCPCLPLLPRFHTSLGSKVGLGFRRAPPCVLACSKCPGGLCANGAPAYPCCLGRTKSLEARLGWGSVAHAEAGKF